jgi:hypothetical protein
LDKYRKRCRLGEFADAIAKQPLIARDLVDLVLVAPDSAGEATLLVELVDAS